ncbi:hypothetical protein [Ramlibacter rhizophilus]|uniref:Uncharacterized protein n=1 Tax=Ramlibacter rhizophilus TaxID=1781167 RepID=A0A4Z0BF72_9BURK|nr:hypothetical protein [Ramlibacter rhizophilus]TFY97470.1 hypothetical protein EZ242_18285 [Ramlibacter rhizophilus]
MPDTSLLLALLVQSVLVPFAAAGALAWTLRHAACAPAAMALAVAAGFLASYMALVPGAWPWPPQSAMDWQPWVVLASCAGALVIDAEKRRGPRQFVARAVLGSVLGLLLVWPAVGSLGVAKAGTAALVAGVLMAGVWSLRTNARFPAGTHPLRLAAVAGGAGIALMLDSSQTAGQLSGALAMALVACAVIGQLRATLASPAVGTVVLVLGTLLLQAHVYAGFPLGYVALLLAGTVADVVPALLIRPGRASSERGARVTSALLTLVPVVAVIGMAIKTLQESGGY